VPLKKSFFKYFQTQFQKLNQPENCRSVCYSGSISAKYNQFSEVSEKCPKKVGTEKGWYFFWRIVLDKSKFEFKCTKKLQFAASYFFSKKHLIFPTNHVKRVLWLNKTWDDIKFLLNSIELSMKYTTKEITLPKKNCH